MSLTLVPASQYSIEELTTIYNHTRVDYLVPMPMSVDVLAEYIHDFDVRLDLSAVALDEDGQFAGLGMLGQRGDLAWVTRLGVIPDVRRKGTGAAIMNRLLEGARQIKARAVYLEVIKNNTPAYNLFLKNGFTETEEYLVMRRAPIPPTLEPQGKLSWLFRKDALALLRTIPHPLTWINARSSMENASNLQGFRISLPDSSKGWLVYRHKKFSLTHLVLYTEEGDPVGVAKNLLIYLHRQYRREDTYAENIHVYDPHLPALQELGYFEAFRRIEMKLELS